MLIRRCYTGLYRGLYRGLHLGMYKKLCFILIIAASFNLVACQNGAPWETKDISNLMPDLDFTMTEAGSGLSVTPKAFRGDFLLMFFGYTNCPDVCPATLARLKSVVNRLDEPGKDIRILFVTVDPKRDTLKVMKEYAKYYGKNVIALRGTQDQLRALTREYRVTYGYDKPDKNGNYAVSHSSAVYIFNRKGEARLLVRPTDTMEAIEHDLKRLVNETDS